MLGLLQMKSPMNENMDSNSWYCQLKVNTPMTIHHTIYFPVTTQEWDIFRTLVYPLFPRILMAQLLIKWYGGPQPRRRWLPLVPGVFMLPMWCKTGHPFMCNSPDSTMSWFPPQQKLTFKILPDMQTGSTQSTTHHVSSASGLGYHASEKIYGHHCEILH